MNDLIKELQFARDHVFATGDAVRLAMVVTSNLDTIIQALERSSVDSVMGVEEAAALWDLSPGRIKNICAEGKIEARKIGKTWIIKRSQPNPRQIKK